jgi:hypothetical protein
LAALSACAALTVSAVGVTVPLSGGSNGSGVTTASSVATAAAAENTVSSQVSVILKKTTAIVTDTSGYEATIEIKNSSDTPLQEGTLTLSTSSSSFSSSTSMQNWADAETHVPTPLTLDTESVPALKKGGSTTLHVGLESDDAALGRIHSWGAKPLLLNYHALTDTEQTADQTAVDSQLHSYFTRSHDGFKEAATPKITITTVLPLTAVKKDIEKDGIHDLISDPATGTDITQGSDEAATETKNEVSLANKHRSLQVIADPDSLLNAGNLRQSALAGLMQPYAFDITSRALVNSQTWAKAGITDSAWDADAAHTLAKTRLQEVNDAASNSTDDDSDSANSKDSTDSADSTDSGSSTDSTDSTDSEATKLTTSDLTPIAWEGKYSWDNTSLSLAKQQGYSTVISETAEHSIQANVVSGRQNVETENGEVTVLVADETLSTLAQGEQTSATAQAEESQAGRLARFVAQTALFQMQRPYVSRNLLISLGDVPSISAANEILTALESSDWVSRGTIASLIKSAHTSTDTDTGTDTSGDNDADTSADNDSSSSDDTDLQPDNSADNENFTLTTTTASDAQIKEVENALDRLEVTTTAIERLRTAIIKESAITQDDEGAKNSDPQALSRQNAQENDGDKVTAAQWLGKLTTVHQDLALMAFGATSSVRNSMLTADESMAETLYSSVSVVPPSGINVFSETAQTPTTVKNMLPFPISIMLRATTDSNAITITSKRNIEVPAGSEAQATFKIRVVGTGSAIATFATVDRDGHAFGTAQSSTIKSQLTIYDMSGNVLIILALLLGAVGIYRQATRRKDPDQ